MRHQRTHNNDNDNSTAARQPVVKTENPTPQQRPPVTAAELKSTRCQRCRKRCKTSTELMAHLATCQGIATTVVNNNTTSRPAAEESEVTLDQETPQQHHPMENKIFVWNTALVPTSEDEITVTPIAEVPKIKTSPVKREQHDEEEKEKKEDDNDDDDEDEVDEDEDEVDEDENDEENQRDEVYPPSTDLSLQQKPQQGTIRKDGKMYKTVSYVPKIISNYFRYFISFIEIPIVSIFRRKRRLHS